MAPPVIVISGLGAPRAAAVAYGMALETRGFRVFTAPQRWLGYGDVRRASRDVRDEIARVRERTGAEKVDLVGMSLGGLIGLQVIKLGGGAPFVRRFVSVGGPLRGSTVARVAEWVPVPFVHAIAQTTPDNALMRELHAAPMPEGPELFSLGATGDVLTPRSSWDVEGMRPVESPYGVFPFGHWQLFLNPRNLDLVAKCLRGESV